MRYNIQVSYLKKSNRTLTFQSTLYKVPVYSLDQQILHERIGTMFTIAGNQHRKNSAVAE